MKDFREIDYENLPTMLAKKVSAKQYLCGYKVIDVDHYVIWVLDESTGKQRELEFSITQNRFLTREERELKLPQNNLVVFGDLGVEVNVSYGLEIDTDVMYEYYQVSSINDAKKISHSSQPYFISFKDSLEVIVVSAVQAFNFPKIYNAWSKNEKIDYWVETLYRIRRHHGEDGGNEDDVFDRSLVTSIMRVDDDIVRLLPFCIKKLAELEQIDGNILLSSFRKKTGVL